ncbi:MAG: hypothetical protein L6461_10120 [Anaerolineae bacterium]|nr:hypothetical protein [Anaerolineae bacterium]
MHDFFMGFIVTFFVGHVPAQGAEKFIQELAAQFGLVLAGSVVRQILFEGFDKFCDDFWGGRGHGHFPVFKRGRCRLSLA